MLRKLAIEYALRRPAPDTVPLSGPDALKNDFFTTYVDFPKDNWKVLLKESQPLAYESLMWIDEKNGRSVSILKRAVLEKEATIAIIFWYKGYKYEYRSPFYFIASMLCRWPAIIRRKDILLQRKYNRRPLVRSERMELLKYLVERTIAEPDKSFNVIDLGMTIYSHRWFYHPERQEHEAHLRLILESFVETGDVERANIDYVLKPNALATVANFEREEQQHRDSQKTSNTANKLTVAVVIIGSISIIVRVVLWYLEQNAA